MKALALVPAAILLLGACHTRQPDTAAGATAATDIEQTFLALDENRDGMLSRAEASQSPALDRAFPRADANGDGMLNRYEYNSPAWRPFAGEPN